ncbi:MAG: DUF2029 domain-containing protein [Chloroflexi bacterium]|nr:DUF2029 domain-containing protein [Chloroflexota bacterium]
MANTRAALTRLAPVLLVAFGLVMLLLATRSFVGSSGFAYDYQAYDAAARRLAAGQPLYPPGTAEAYNSGSYAGLYLYPPPPAVALMPLVAVAPPDAAAMAWLWLRLTALALGIAILPISALARAGTFATASISFPVWYDLNLGNTSVLLVALSAFIWRFQGRALGSVALAISGVLRYPFGIALIGWIAAKRWRAAAWAIGAGVVIAALTLPLVGLNGWLGYLAIVRGLGDVSSGPNNLSLATTAQAFGIPGPSAMWVFLQIGVALAATLFAARRRDPVTAVVVSLAATILFFPFFHPHYLVQLLIPAAFLAGRGQWWGLALPLLGWLPGELMPFAAIAGALLPLIPARWATLSGAAAFPGAAAEFGTGPTRP